MQRFVGIELKCSGTSARVANHLELIPEHQSGLASRSLREFAAREEGRALKLETLQTKIQDDRKKGRKART